jgi:integral membrane protein (TIGR01906 family)
MQSLILIYGVDILKYDLKNNFYLNIFLEILLSLSLAILITILIVKLTLNLKIIYYLDIVHLDIPKLSKLEISEIKSNYSYVIEYINNPSMAEFSLPTLPYSIEGKIHFQEVKAIFIFLTNLAYILCFTILVLFIPTYKNRRYTFLKLTSIFLLILPIICFIPFLINFDKSFTIFHKILFNNDYWLLDTKKDPIINMMPQSFFFHCAIFIILMLILSSIAFCVMYIKKKPHQYKKNKGDA